MSFFLPKSMFIVLVEGEARHAYAMLARGKGPTSCALPLQKMPQVVDQAVSSQC